MDSKLKAIKELTASPLSPEQQRIGVYITVAVALVLLLTLLLWNTVITSIHETRFQLRLNELAQTQQQAVTRYEQSIIKQLTSFVQDSETIRVLSNRKSNQTNQPSEQVKQLQQKLKDSIQFSIEANIFFPGEAQRIKDSGGNIGFVELNMINRLEKNKPVLPEAARVSETSKWEINWVFAVNKSDSADTQQAPLAIIHLATSTDELQQSLSTYNMRLARTDLSQKIERQGMLKFLTLGQGGGYGSQTAQVPQTYWQLDIYPSKLFVSSTSATPLWFYLLILIIAGPAVWAAYYFADKKNQQLASLYHTLDIQVGGSPEASTTEETEEDSAELSDPIYLSDKQLDVSDEDQALVTGANQQKQPGSATKSTTAVASEKDSVAAPEHIFRAYDIRGLVEPDFTPELVEAIGKAIASEALEQGETSLLLGRDARSHSAQIFESLIKGVLTTGCDIIDVGLVPTPLLNFATVFSDQSSSGIIVTASHNPKEYNGFKIVLNERSLVEEDMQKLHQRINQGLFINNEQSPGSISNVDFTEDYIDTIAADIAINAGMQMVIDAGNGASSGLAPAVFKELGCEVTELYCEFDGEFPNHDPDPTNPNNLQDLIARVAELNADLGLALDGDGDRLVIVTSQGKIIWPDQLLMLFARDVVSRNPGCDVIFDIKCTRHLNQVISSYGGRPIMWKTGHSNIKAKMRETNALLAGEFSGHIFFKERWFGFDDGIYAAARLLEIMSLRDQSLDDMFSALPEALSTSEIRIDVGEDAKFSLIEQLIEQGDFSPGEKTTIDGLRVDFAKGWGLVRASNTSPALTLRFEADTEGSLEQLKSLFKRELAKIDGNLTLDF